MDGSRGSQSIVAATTPLLVTVTQAAELLGVSRSTAYELIATHQLEVVHIGRAARVPVDAVRSYVDRLRAIDDELADSSPEG
jgi:excisionase family DNA binding protein